jgi:hypothetical protein
MRGQWNFQNSNFKLLRTNPAQRLADFGPRRSIRRDGNAVFPGRPLVHDPLENHSPQARENSSKDHGQNHRLSVLGHAAILVTQTTPGQSRRRAVPGTVGGALEIPDDGGLRT